MMKYKRLITILVIISVLDISFRFLTGFNMPLIIRFEAVLFLLTSALLFWFVKKRTATDQKIINVEKLFTYFFLIGAVRSMVWVFSGDVFSSNIATLLFTILLVLLYMVKRK